MRFLLSLLLLLPFIHTAIQQDTQCDATRQCEQGCCSSAGFCGYGPDYCGDGCLSTCNRKSDCNPGWSSSRFSKEEKCPLNVCCSKHGFCGLTDEFCDDEDNFKRPSCSAGSKVNRVMGYFESWSTTERSCYNMRPEAIPYGMYTDIIFSFATINPTTFRATAGSRHTANYMENISTIKLFQPDIRIWIALGGWAFNDPGPTQTTFSDIAASEAKTETFLDSLASMVREYEFDGVDIDWEYPMAEDRHGRPEDYKNIVTFMKKLRARMSRMRKRTSMAIPASYWYLQNFDIQALEETVDWFNIMTYDVHGSWDIKNEWTGPWANSHTNMTEIQQGLDLLWRNGIDPAKVTMGMAFYSRSFTLTNAQACNSVGCRVASAGNPGACSDTAGVLLHPEIADIVKKRGLSPQLHRDAAVKTVSWDNQWVSFDDAATWRLKANMAKSQCVNGFMVWAMSHDDDQFTNAKALNQALGRKIPEAPAIQPGSGSTPEVSVAPLLCRWTSCFEDCPSGFKAVKRDGHDEVMLDSKNCLRRVNNFMQFEVGRGMMKWCCPSNQPQPTCTWRGHRNSGKCRRGCESGEVEVGSLRAGCSKGHQSACCKSTEVTAAYGECVWMPCADEDGDWSKQCFGNFNHFLLAAKEGSGDMGQCKGKKKRALCCPKPPPAAFDTNCRWHRRLQSADKNSCDGSCPSDHVRLALEGGKEQGEKCEWKKAFCCADPKPLEPQDEKNGSGNDLYERFEYLLHDYLKNPMCPNDELAPTIPAAFLRPVYNESPVDDVLFRNGKRSLKDESRKYESLRRQAISCTMTDWKKLIDLAARMFTNPDDRRYNEMRRLWDDEFADNFDENLTVERLDSHRITFNLEPRFLVTRVLLEPRRMGQELREMEQSTSDLCVLPDSLNSMGSMRLASNSSSSWNVGQTATGAQDGGDPEVDQRLKARLVTVPGTAGSKTSQNHVPSWATILQAINAGNLTLHYARWQWYSGQNAVGGPRPGPMLELAYWIGPVGTEGTSYTNNRAAYDQYRDTTPSAQFLPLQPQQGAPREDNWVIIHIHVNTNVPYLSRQLTTQGTFETLLGTDGISIFHGQTWLPGWRGTQWRVNNDVSGPANGPAHGQPRARRGRGWHCPQPSNNAAQLFWLGGGYPRQGGARANWQHDMVRWASDLHRSGIVGVNGLRLIIAPPPGGRHGVINAPSQSPGPGRLVRPGRTTPASNGASPYSRNFLVTNNGNINGYNFNIAQPDMSLHS